VCTLDLVLTPAEGPPGAEIVVTGTPLTELRDTRIQVGGVQATALTLTRTGCDTCDDCRDDAGCAPCGLCAGVGLDPGVQDTCFGDPIADPPVPSSCDSCVETFTFRVPDLPPGPAPVIVFNATGQSPTLTFVVTAAPPGGSGATGDTSATGSTPP
jgi:hypothetical protein